MSKMRNVYLLNKNQLMLLFLSPNIKLKSTHLDIINIFRALEHVVISLCQALRLIFVYFFVIIS